MARRVGLPAPSLNPYGGEAQAFGEYDVLDAGREKGIEFQKAQAAWAAGKITDDAYLGAYQKYVGTLPKNSSARINAEEGLARERYTLARNDITARIDAGDEQGWEALLAFDRASLAGLQTNNEEYQRRLGYLRSTQQSYFNDQWNKKAKAFQMQRITATQLRSWLQGALGSSLTDDNAALRTDIGGRIDDLTYSITEERREEVFRRWSDGDMDPGEFLVYARQQLHQFAQGTAEYKQWKERLVDARANVAEANLLYRWQLSAQYFENRQQLQAPPPGGKGEASRTIYTEGGWKTVPVETPPSPADQEAYAEWQQSQGLLQEQQRRIERSMAAIGGQFVTPDQMVGWYRDQQGRTAKGTPAWFALQEKIASYRDTQMVWETFNTDNGYFPVITKGGKLIQNTQGRRLPGEESVTVATFMRALGSQFGGKKVDQLGGVNRFGVDKEQWKAWAQQFLGDASARQSPKNMELVVRSKLTELHKTYGSWALVADWWANGSLTGNGVTDWSGGTREFVDSIWRMMGLGSLPSSWTFDPSKYGAKAQQAVGVGDSYADYGLRHLVPSPGPQSFGDGWGYRTDQGSGASLGDVSAGAQAYGVQLTDQNVSWAELKRRLKNGESAVANGLMSEVLGTGLERYGEAFARTGTDSRHSVHLIRYRNGKIFWQDPLRAEGTGKGEWVNEDVVLKFIMGFSSDGDDLAVAMSNQRVEHIPQIVDEHEPGPWTGCAWASTAMLVNGVKGRRVVEMEDVRWRGESGQYAGHIFDAPYGQASTAELRKAALQGTGGAKSRNRDKFPKTDGKVPVTPGPQPGPATYRWGQPYDPNTTIGGSYGNPNLQTDRGDIPATRKAGQFQMQIVTGPPTKVGDDPKLKATSGPVGMGVKDFDTMYDRASAAFLTGETTFVAYDSKGNLVNYWFPHQGEERLGQMMYLDEVRIQLREQEYLGAEAALAVAGDDPTAELLDDAAEARERHLSAVEDAGSHYFEMLFMEESFREEEATKGGKVPQTNVNPGADINRLGRLREDAMQVHLDQADRYIAAGLFTQGYSELQAASDIAAMHARDMDTFAEQVQQGTASQLAQGRKPSEGQRADIEAATSWRETFNFGEDENPAEGTTLGDIQKRLGSISTWIDIDPMTKRPVYNADGQLRMRPGAAFVLNHGTGEAPDTLEPQYLDVTNATPGPTSTSFGVDRHKPGYITASVALMGRSVMAQVPYLVGEVGVVRTKDGGEVPLMGKIVNVNVEGRHQVAYENPFRPGEWTMATDANGETQGFLFKGPDNVGAITDKDTGNVLLTWKEGSTTFSLSYNPAAKAYEVIGQKDADPLGIFNEGSVEPEVLGSLASSPDLRSQVSSLFERDTSSIARDQQAASRMTGLHVGWSAQQYETLTFNESRRRMFQARGFGLARRNLGQASKPYDPLSSINAGTRTPVIGTSTPDAVKQMADERARTAATAKSSPSPVATPTTAPTTAPKAVPTPQPTPQPTAPKTPVTMVKPPSYDPLSSITAPTTMVPTAPKYSGPPPRML